MSLNLQSIRDADGRKTKELDVPEMGGSLRIRMMSGTDLFRISEQIQKKPDDTERHARMLFVSTIVDDEDKPLFTGQTVEALMNQSSRLVMWLSEEIQEFCGLTGDSKDTVKNSEMTPA